MWCADFPHDASKPVQIVPHLPQPKASYLQLPMAVTPDAKRFSQAMKHQFPSFRSYFHPSVQNWSTLQLIYHQQSHLTVSHHRGKTYGTKRQIILAKGSTNGQENVLFAAWKRIVSGYARNAPFLPLNYRDARTVMIQNANGITSNDK